MINDNIVVNKVRDLLMEDEYVASHDFYHLDRVYNNVVAICTAENIPEKDALISSLAALMHDISQKKVSYLQYSEHEYDSAEKARLILEKLDVDPEVIKDVERCIIEHRASKGIKSPILSVQILQDADRLDALGALAIARTFSYDSNRPIYLPDVPPKENYDGISLSSMNHIVEKILNLKPEAFNTKTAQKIAENRLKFVEVFVKEFFLEWDGKDI